jgi:hypothetical protein
MEGSLRSERRVSPKRFFHNLVMGSGINLTRPPSMSFLFFLVIELIKSKKDTKKENKFSSDFN